MLEGCLPELTGELGCWVVHEVAIWPKHVLVLLCSWPRLAGVRAAIAAMLCLLLWDRWRRRSELRHGRYVLWYRMVEGRRRMAVCWTLHCGCSGCIFRSIQVVVRSVRAVYKGRAECKVARFLSVMSGMQPKTSICSCLRLTLVSLLEAVPGGALTCPGDWSLGQSGPEVAATAR